MYLIYQLHLSSTKIRDILSFDVKNLSALNLSYTG